MWASRGSKVALRQVRRALIATKNTRVYRPSSLLQGFSEPLAPSSLHFGSMMFSTETTPSSDADTAADDSAELGLSESDDIAPPSSDDNIAPSRRSGSSGTASDNRTLPFELRRELHEKMFEDFESVLERVSTEHRNGYIIPYTFVRGCATRIAQAARNHGKADLEARGFKSLEPAASLKMIEDLIARSKDWDIDEKLSAFALINIHLICGNQEQADAIFHDAKNSFDAFRNDIVLPFIAAFAENGDVQGFRTWLDKEYPATEEELDASKAIKETENSGKDQSESRIHKDTPRTPGRPRYLASRQFLWSLIHAGDMEKCDEFLNALNTDTTWTARLGVRNPLLHWILRGNSTGITNAQEFCERHNMAKDVGGGHMNGLLRRWLKPKGTQNGNVAEALRMVKACQGQGIHVPLSEFVNFSKRALQDNAVPRLHFLLYRLEEHGMSKGAWRTLFNGLLQGIDENTVAHVPMLWRALQRRGGPNAATRAILTSKESRYRYLQNPDVPSSMLSFLGLPGQQDWTQQAAAPAMDPHGYPPNQQPQWNQQPPAQQQPQWGAPPQQYPPADPWGQQAPQHGQQQPQYAPQPQWGPAPYADASPNYAYPPQNAGQQQQPPPNSQQW